MSRDPFIEWLVKSLKPEDRERARRMTTRDLRKLWGFSDGTAQDNTDENETEER